MRNGFSQKLAQFFMGRNGVDMMSRFFLYLGVIFSIITMFSHSIVFYFLGIACLFYSIFRMFSKNISKRHQENEAFANRTFPIRNWWSRLFYNIRTGNLKNAWNSYWADVRSKRVFRQKQKEWEKNAKAADKKAKAEQKAKEKQMKKDYAIFKCPECGQKLRAPKGRGKIEVTCSKCKHVFIKKV